MYRHFSCLPFTTVLDQSHTAKIIHGLQLQKIKNTIMEIFSFAMPCSCGKDLELNNSFYIFMQSHKDEVHALAVHPNETQFISASLDHTVSLWDAETHQVIWTISVEVSYHSFCLSHVYSFNSQKQLTLISHIIQQAGNENTNTYQVEVYTNTQFF